MKAIVTELPFNNFLGIQIADEPSLLLRLPSGKQYLNHLGTVHARGSWLWPRHPVANSYYATLGPWIALSQSFVA